MLKENLEKEIDEKKKSYEENTIEMQIKKGAAKIAVSSLSITSIAGIVIGTVTESPILIGGAFFGLCAAFGLQIRKSK